MRGGWFYYGPRPFKEDINRILEILGSICYEVYELEDRVYIRRVQD